MSQKQQDNSCCFFLYVGQCCIHYVVPRSIISYLCILCVMTRKTL